jgi:hypothetical protein
MIQTELGGHLLGELSDRKARLAHKARKGDKETTVFKDRQVRKAIKETKARKEFKAHRGRKILAH